MNPKAKEILIIFALLIIAAYFLFNGLVLAKAFLAPLAIAILLTMVMIPLSNKMEKWGISRGWSAFISVIILFISFIAIFFLVAIEINKISQDWPKIESSLKPKIEEFQSYIYEKTGINPSKQENMIPDIMPQNSGSSDSKQESSDKENDNQQGSESGDTEKPSSTTENSSQQQSDDNNQGNNSSNVASSIGQGILGFFSFIGTSLLTLIYIFFFLYYRNKIKNSILKFTSSENRKKTKEILNNSIKVSQSYLVGRLLLILFLAIIYAIGLSVSGIQHAIIISVIAALLSLMPYIGNIVGFSLAMAMAAFSGGELMMFLGVVITFSIAQFIESYILEPYLVGHKVELNPFITIVVVVLGGAVWGIMGMIISIPIFGILKIIFDHIPVLNPLGYALGEEDIGSDEEENIFAKIFKKIKK